MQQQNYSNFAIALVDNGSEDDSVAAVQNTFPEVAILENGRNLGIAAANNVGIRYALENSGEYIFLLNNDTTVDPNMLADLVQVQNPSPVSAWLGRRCSTTLIPA